MTTPPAPRDDDRDPRSARGPSRRAAAPSRPSRGVDLRGRRGRDLRLPRPERGRQDHDAADARDADHARRRARRPSPARTCDASRSRSARRIGYVPAGRLDRSGRDRPRRARPPGPALRHVGKRDAKARAAEVLAALDLEAAADRPTGTYSGGMRRRLDVGLGHRPPAAGPVPRRADDRPRPAGAGPDVGRDPRPPRARDDRLPHDPLPRGGRRAVRPPRDHRPRADRRRGHVRRAQADRSPATS